MPYYLEIYRWLARGLIERSADMGVGDIVVAGYETAPLTRLNDDHAYPAWILALGYCEKLGKAVELYRTDTSTSDQSDLGLLRSFHWPYLDRIENQVMQPYLDLISAEAFCAR